MNDRRNQVSSVCLFTLHHTLPTGVLEDRHGTRPLEAASGGGDRERGRRGGQRGRRRRAPEEVLLRPGNHEESAANQVGRLYVTTSVGPVGKMVTH